MDVECQALRPAQPSIECPDSSVRVYGVDGIEAGGCGAGHIKRSIRRKGEMISSNAGFQGRKHEYLPVFSNTPNGPCSVPDIKILVMIESDAGRYAHALGIGAHGAVGSYTIDSPIVTRRDVQLPGAVQCNPC